MQVNDEIKDNFRAITNLLYKKNFLPKSYKSEASLCYGSETWLQDHSSCESLYLQLFGFLWALYWNGLTNQFMR